MNIREELDKVCVDYQKTVSDFHMIILYNIRFYNGSVTGFKEVKEREKTNKPTNPF